MANKKIKKYSDREKSIIRDYCRGCPKFKRLRVRCDAFTDPYPLWGEEECWARPEQANISASEVRQCMKEDQRRGKGGGGEKQKGNEMFGKQRMKDNRVMIPWSGYIR